MDRMFEGLNVSHIYTRIEGMQVRFVLGGFHDLRLALFGIWGLRSCGVWQRRYCGHDWP